MLSYIALVGPVSGFGVSRVVDGEAVTLLLVGEKRLLHTQRELALQHKIAQEGGISAVKRDGNGHGSAVLSS